jgi:hypothetical protein
MLRNVFLLRRWKNKLESLSLASLALNYLVEDLKILGSGFS